MGLDVNGGENYRFPRSIFMEVGQLSPRARMVLSL
jgi:hypothetical protein